MPLPHPFYPPATTLSSPYHPNDLDARTILALFSAGCTALLISALAIARTRRPSLSTQDQALALWFVLSAFIHIVLESYSFYNHARLPTNQDFLGQLWKEYALADSRYMTDDPLVFCIDGLTAITLGPLCLLLVYLILTASPYRHCIQLLVSTLQLYGDVLYYLTGLCSYYFMGISHTRPEGVYFWGYFIGANVPWVVVPAWCIYNSVKAMAGAIGQQTSYIQGKGDRNNSKKG
ncbi:hypothetical protein MMC30_006420 [Trapelia coarctata]|nr:hypothetical protein [Trapelia coarctata]